MQALKAHVRNGYFVSDEPTDLPEGTEATLLVEDPYSELAPEERAAIQAELEDAARNLDEGDFLDAKEFITRLRAKRPEQ